MRILSAESTAERSSNIKQTAMNNPVFCCDQCTASFDTNSKLQAHKCKKHNIRNQYQQLVTTSTCPLCGTNYKTIRKCQDHITKVRGPKAIPAAKIRTDQLKIAQQELLTKQIPKAGSNIHVGTVTCAPNIQALLSRTQRRPPAQVLGA